MGMYSVINHTRYEILV